MMLRKMLAGALALAFVLSLSASAQETRGTLSAGQLMIGQSDGNVAPKSLSGDVTNDATGAATIQPNAVTSGKIAANAVTNAKMNPGAANTMKGSLNGSSTTDLAITSCSAIYQFTQWVSGSGWQCGLIPLLPSRATAATLNLSAFSVVQTQGYALPADGGDALFKKVTQNQRDVFVTAGSISQASSGCTNGTYRGLWFTGGNGKNFRANVTVAGNIVSAVAIAEQGGNGYAVGDVLSPVNGNAAVGSCSGAAFTWTVSTVSTPLASFTDSGSTKWEYTVGASNYINSRAFGAKWDWNATTGDAGATNDTAAIQASYGYANYANPNALFSAFGKAFASTKVVHPAGTALFCATLNQWSSVVVEGQGPMNTVLKLCDAGIGGANNAYNLCDVTVQQACFGVLLKDIRLDATTTSGANANTFMLFTNAAQQNRVIDNVAVYPGLRGCLNYDTGYGGAASALFDSLFCTISTTTTASGISITNVGTTVLTFNNLNVESPATNSIVSGMNATTGQVVVNGGHTEGIAVPFTVNLATATHSFTLMNYTGGNGCTSLVSLSATNTAGNAALYNVVKNGCSPNLVLDGQAGGTNRTADARPKDGWVSFNP